MPALLTLAALFACIIAVGTLGVLLDNIFGDDREHWTVTVRERVQR